MSHNKPTAWPKSLSKPSSGWKVATCKVVTYAEWSCPTCNHDNRTGLDDGMVTDREDRCRVCTQKVYLS